jgi:hypothetical protein
MNMTQRYDHFFKLTKDAQAAATLCLAEVIQGTTHNVDLTFNNGAPTLDVEVAGGRYPIQVEQR